MIVNEKIQTLLKMHKIRLAWGTAGVIQVGTNLSILPDATIEGYSTIATGNMLPLRLGAFSYSQSALPLDARVGRFCSIGDNLLQMGDRHPTDRFSSSPITYDHYSNYMILDYIADNGVEDFGFVNFEKSIHGFSIGHDVWIGMDVLVAQGVTIGTGAIVAARSVVTKNVPPYAIVAGVPARLIKYRYDEQTVEDFLRIKWWDYRPEQVVKLTTHSPDCFLALLKDAIAQNTIQLAQYPTLRSADLEAVQ